MCKDDWSICNALQEYDQETKDYEVERHAVFWSDDGCKSLYKNHLRCAEYLHRLHGRAHTQAVLTVCEGC